MIHKNNYGVLQYEIAGLPACDHVESYMLVTYRVLATVLSWVLLLGSLILIWYWVLGHHFQVCRFSLSVFKRKLFLIIYFLESRNLCCQNSSYFGIDFSNKEVSKSLKLIHCQKTGVSRYLLNVSDIFKKIKSPLQIH